MATLLSGSWPILSVVTSLLSANSKWIIGLVENHYLNEHKCFPDCSFDIVYYRLDLLGLIPVVLAELLVEL